MSKYLRKEEILEYIKDKKVCTADELQKKFDISISTVHRDLNILEREGSISKFYGKVTVNEEESLFKSRININVDLKRKIAQKAIEFIENDDCIFLDSSTTVYYLAEALCKSSFKNILVVSNNAFIPNLFLNSKNIDLVLTGGKLNKELNCFAGPQAIKTIDGFNGNKFFLSASRISKEGGIGDIFYPDAIDVKTKMLQKSRESYLLIDATKLGKISTSKWFEIGDMNHIITDSNISGEWLQEFRNIGVDLIIT